MRTLLFLFASVALAQLPITSPANYVDIIDYTIQSGAANHTIMTADTWYFTAWSSASTCSGNFTGGCVYGTANDAANVCPAGGSLHVTKLNVLDWNTKSNTAITCVNSMSTYGTNGQINFPVGWTDGNTWKNGMPMFGGGNLYMHVFRQQQSGPFLQTMSTKVLSRDAGAHWSNPSHVNLATVSAASCTGSGRITATTSASLGLSAGNTVHLHGSSPSGWDGAGTVFSNTTTTLVYDRVDATCPGSSYVSGGKVDLTDVNGDAPANSSTGMMWPGSGTTDTTNKMTVMFPIACGQDQVCPVGNTGDSLDTYQYFVSKSGDFTNLYSARVLKSDLDSLDETKYQYWNGSAYVSGVANAVSIAGALSGNTQLGSINSTAWIPAFNSYVMIAELFINSYKHTQYAWAPHPWGPWTLTNIGILAAGAYGNGEPALAYPITAATCTGNVVTLTAQNGLTVGDKIDVFNSVPSFWNSGATTFTVAAGSTTTTVQYNVGSCPVYAVTSVSKAAAAVVSITGHQLTSGNSVVIAGATGDWAALNGTRTVTVIDANSFSVAVNSSAFAGSFNGTITAYVSGGFVRQNGVNGSGEDFPGIIYATMNTSCAACNSSAGAPVVEVVVSGDDYAHLGSASPYFIKRLLYTSVMNNGANAFGDQFRWQTPFKFSLTNDSDTIPANGLVWFWSFDDNIGFRRTAFPTWYTTSIKERITGATCTPSTEVGGNLSANWKWATIGGASSNLLDASYFTRCVSSTNVPISGNAARTVIQVFRPTTVNNTFNILMNWGGYSAGQNWGLNIHATAGGNGFIEVNQGLGDSNHAGSVTAGNWYVAAVTYSGGGLTKTAGTNIYLNGALMCGSLGPACGGSDANVPNTSATPMVFAEYGNHSPTGTCTGAQCDYQLPFLGTFGPTLIYNRALSKAEITMTCRALKKYMAMPPWSAALTCN